MKEELKISPAKVGYNTTHRELTYYGCVQNSQPVFSYFYLSVGSVDSVAIKINYL